MLADLHEGTLRRRAVARLPSTAGMHPKTLGYEQTLPGGRTLPSAGRGARAAGDALVIRGEASLLRRAF